MNTRNTVYAFALALVLGTTAALGSPGSGACEQHPTAPFCQGEGGEGEPNGNNQTASSNSSSEASAESTSNSLSGSNSSSNSYASGGNLRSDIDVSGGESSSSSSAVSGDSRASASGGNASGGDALAVAGDSEATIGDVLVTSDIGGVTSESGSNSNDISYSTSYEAKASSAATVFAGYCQTGGSAQMDAGGFSVVNPEAFCNHIRAAAVFREAYIWEMNNGSVQCAKEASIVHTSGQFADMCDNEQAKVYLARYHDNLSDAHSLLESTEAVGKVDAFTGYLIRPLAILALLILL